jgi:hypothetical protein
MTHHDDPVDNEAREIRSSGELGAYHIAGLDHG